MELKELKTKSKKELQILLPKLRDKLRVMRFKVAQRQLKKVHEIKQTKKQIARVLTLLKNINNNIDKIDKKKTKF